MIRNLLSLLLCILTSIPAIAQGWAQPRVSVTSLRSKPAHSAEQVSQVVMGTPLKVISRDGNWWMVETPEGYKGYVRSNTLTAKDNASMERWRKSTRGVVIADGTIYAYSSPFDADTDAERVTDLVGGVILEVTDTIGNRAGVTLPDGRKGFVDINDMMEIKQWATQSWNPSFLPTYARRLLGTPYVWGGTSSKGMDCSGLTQISAYRYGLLLPRDASQQVAVGEVIPTSDFTQFLPGDLLFFGNTHTGRINHVAIYIGNGQYIHSSGRVRISSINPSSADYENPGLIAVRRITETVADSISLRRNSLYF